VSFPEKSQKPQCSGEISKILLAFRLYIWYNVRKNLSGGGPYVY